MARSRPLKLSKMMCKEGKGFGSLGFRNLNVSLRCVLHGTSCSIAVELQGLGSRQLRCVAETIYGILSCASRSFFM